MRLPLLAVAAVAAGLAAVPARAGSADDIAKIFDQARAEDHARQQQHATDAATGKAQCQAIRDVLGYYANRAPLGALFIALDAYRALRCPTADLLPLIQVTP